MVERLKNISQVLKKMKAPLKKLKDEAKNAAKLGVSFFPIIAAVSVILLGGAWMDS